MAQNKVKIVKVLNAITLESTEAATQADANRVIVEAYESERLNLCCLYTTGDGETTNTCDIFVYGYDGTNWVPLGLYAVAGGIATATPTTFRIAGAAAATGYSASFVVDPIVFTKIKVTALESGVATNKGTLTVVALVS